MAENEKEIELSKLAQHVAMATLSHPFTQARVLMQLGYEPGPVTVKGPGWTSVWGLLGKNEPTRYRAGVLTGYLRQANITDNLTTGLTMSICEVVASSCAQTAVTEELEKYLPPANSEEDQYRNYNQVLKDASRETAIKSAGIIVSNPFRVIAIRQIASIAGGTNTDTNVKDVLLSGDIFAGLIPRIAFEASVTFISKSLKYLSRENGDLLGIEKNNQTYFDIAIDHVTNIFVYPLKLLSTIRSISGTGLRLDDFPELTALELYCTLRTQGETHRGSSTIFDRKCPPIKSKNEIVGEPVITSVKVESEEHKE